MTDLPDIPELTLETGRNAILAMREEIEKNRAELRAALPREMSVDHFKRTIFSAFNQNPKLITCTRSSILNSIIQLAELGLRPNVGGEAYLIPYGNVCTPIAGFRGLMKAAYRGGKVLDIKPMTVRDTDEFRVIEGTDRRIEHLPNKEKVGNLTHVYAIASLHGGVEHFDWMTREECENIKLRNKFWKQTPWNNPADYEPMCWKTVVRRLCKYLPSSSEDLQVALSLDEREPVEVDVTPPPNDDNPPNEGEPPCDDA